MAEITDFFGKASIDTDYAQATTVKTARTPSETVLATFDLSKFSPDTPVFFVTYQKEVDPTTNEVTIVNQTSWKAIVNPDINTLTNLELAPGYVDTGNDVGDYVECIPTSYWGNELVNGLAVSLNPDGTIKVDAIPADSVDTEQLKAQAVTPEKRSGGLKIGIIPGSTFGSTGVKSITGVGFKPRVVEFELLPTNSTSSLIIQASGAMDENGTQYTVAYSYSTSGQARRAETNLALVYMAQTTAITAAMGFEYESMDADGFSIDVKASNATFDVAYRAYA